MTQWVKALTIRASLRTRIRVPGIQVKSWASGDCDSNTDSVRDAALEQQDRAIAEEHARQRAHPHPLRDGGLTRTPSACVHMTKTRRQTRRVERCCNEKTIHRAGHWRILAPFWWTILRNAQEASCGLLGSHTDGYVIVLMPWGAPSSLAIK